MHNGAIQHTYSEDLSKPEMTKERSHIIGIRRVIYF